MKKLILPFLLFSQIMFGQTFPNVASMETASWLGNGALVTLQGFYAANDGGGFTAYIDNSGDTVDDIDVFQIGATTRRAKRIGAPIDIRQLGAKYGTVSDADKVVNYYALKKGINTHKRVVILGELQIKKPANDSITISSDVIIEGAGKSVSSISQYPKRKKYRGIKSLFFHASGNINIKNISLVGYDSRWSFETYKIILKSAGDNILEVKTGQSVRSGFWSSLLVGDTIMVQQNDTIVGFTRIISAIDSVSRKITVSVNFSSSNNYDVDGQTYIGVPWSESASTSNIATYSQTWNSNNLEYRYLFSATATTAQSRFIVDNCNIQGFDITFGFIGHNTDLQLSSTSLQSNSIGVLWTGAATTKYQRLMIKDGDLHDCATLCEASVNSNGVILTNARFGGGVYMHPGIIPYLENVRFYSNNSTSIKNFSSSSNDISGQGWRGVYKNCTWESNNKEPLLILSKSFPSYLEDCKLYAPNDSGVTSIYFGNTTTAIGCVFDAPINFNLNSEPSDGDTVRYEVAFRDCQFLRNGRVNAYEWPGSTLKKTKIYFDNCKFYEKSASSSRIKVKGGILHINNCEVKKNETISSASPFIEVFEGVSSGFTALKIEINNLNYDSTITQTLIAVTGADISGQSNMYANIYNSNIKATTISDGKLKVNRAGFDANAATFFVGLTTTKRNAISSPEPGLQVYNTSLNKLNYYNGSSWLALVDSTTLAGYDPSITNEGALSVGAAGANTSHIATNTSGDGGVILKGGTNITLSESADTITITAASGSGDNLGNHSATQDLDLNSFNITELDSLKSTDTIIVSATKIIANGTSGLDVIRSAGGRVAGLYGSSTIGYLGLLKTSGGTLMTSLGYGDGILTGNLTDATSLRSENALHFAANGDNLILSINSGRVYSNSAELTDFLIAPTDSFNLKVGANGLIASTAFTRLVANGLISFQANHSTGATAMVVPDSTATATSISISGGANAFHVNSANGAEIVTLGTGTTGSTVRLEADTLKVNDIAVSTIWTDGVWTPTLTGVTNVGASTAYECQWSRVGSTVTFSGKLDLDPTATGTTGLGISLPVASNFTAAEKAGGTAKSTSATERTAVIYADAANDRLTLYLEAADTANQSFWFSGSYRIQ